MGSVLQLFGNRFSAFTTSHTTSHQATSYEAKQTTSEDDSLTKILTLHCPTPHLHTLQYTTPSTTSCNTRQTATEDVRHLDQDFDTSPSHITALYTAQLHTRSPHVRQDGQSVKIYINHLDTKLPHPMLLSTPHHTIPNQTTSCETRQTASEDSAYLA